MANPTTLTNGVATDWMETNGLNGLEAQGVITAPATVNIEGANDPALPTKTDIVQIGASLTTSFAKTLFQPLPRYVRMKQVAGAGSAIVSWGQGTTPKGDIVPVTKQGTKAGGPSSDLFVS